MPLKNPSYVDEQAIHRGSVFRTVNYQAMEGMEGVLLNDHLRVVPLGTPGAGITCLPGVYAVHAKHAKFETYLGKIDSSTEIGPNGDGIVAVTPTTSSGPRTDLVILRIENPYVPNSSGYTPPPDKVNGPYAHVVVVPNVPQFVNHVSSVDNTWAAITLARITRPASTSVVTASHITDLRSLANPAGQRIIINDNPPATPPPIAHDMWTNTRHFPTVTSFASTVTSYTNWPSTANFEVPIPEWAAEAEFFGFFNPQYTNDTWGEVRFSITVPNVATTFTSSVMFDENVSVDQASSPGPQQLVIPLGLSYSIPSNQRGKIATIQSQFKMNAPAQHSGNLGTRNGVYMSLMIDFKRKPN